MDTHLGMRIRARRRSLEMPVESVACALAVDSDTLALMEQGAYRLSACQLHQLAQLLDVPISYFFENAPRELAPDFPGSAFADAFAATDEDSAETLDLLRAFLAIADSASRKRVTDLARELAAEQQT